MAVDSFARIIALAALDAAGSGGGSTRGIESVSIIDGELYIRFTDGTETNVGKVVGENGKDGRVYIPHIDDNHVLSWTIEDKEGDIPDPINLGDSGEWIPVPDEEQSDWNWGDMSDDSGDN